MRMWIFSVVTNYDNLKRICVKLPVALNDTFLCLKRLCCVRMKRTLMTITQIASNISLIVLVTVCDTMSTMRLVKWRLIENLIACFVRRRQCVHVSTAPIHKYQSSKEHSTVNLVDMVILLKFIQNWNDFSNSNGRTLNFEGFIEQYRWERFDYAWWAHTIRTKRLEVPKYTIVSIKIMCIGVWDTRFNHQTLQRSARETQCIVQNMQLPVDVIKRCSSFFNTFCTKTSDGAGTTESEKFSGINTALTF